MEKREQVLRVFFGFCSKADALRDSGVEAEDARFTEMISEFIGTLPTGLLTDDDEKKLRQAMQEYRFVTDEEAEAEGQVLDDYMEQLRANKSETFPPASFFMLAAERDWPDDRTREEGVWFLSIARALLNIE